MSKILVIRLSSIGDVAMTIPVVYDVAKANPNHSFTILTQTFLLPLFINRPPNLSILGVSLQTTKSHFFRFALYLRYHDFDLVLDLHNVIRSRLIGLIFRLSGKKVFTVDKRRKERKQLTKRPPKTIHPLMPVTERYAEVFQKAGFHYEKSFVSFFENHAVENSSLEAIFGVKKGRWVGIAPFAKHQGKSYPLEKMEQVVKALSERDDLQIFLFGGSGDEAATLERWEKKFPNTIVASRRFLFDKELALISMLDVLVSMDSANMHLAALVGAKVITIWGATHPYAGFYDSQRREDLIIQADLPCRPCSVYGNKPCYRKDYACLKQITPEQIIQKILSECCLS